MFKELKKSLIACENTSDHTKRLNIDSGAAEGKVIKDEMIVRAKSEKIEAIRQEIASMEENDAHTSMENEIQKQPLNSVKSTSVF